MDNKLVGFEVGEKSVNLEGKDLVGKVSASHVGKLGSLELSLKGKIEFLPMADMVIDWVEKKIPGDQTFFANLLKEQVAKLKITL